MSAFRMKCRTFYGGYQVVSAGLAILNRLAKGACRGMNAAANVAHVVYRPALSFTDHQHFILPGLGSCVSFTRSGILRASVFGMVDALATSALSGSVVRLENGSDFSNVLC